MDKEHRFSKDEQQAALYDHAQSVGLEVSKFFVEEGMSLKRPFADRTRGSRLVAGCVAGDVIVTMNAAWVLSSAGEGVKVLTMLRKNALGALNRVPREGCYFKDSGVSLFLRLFPSDVARQKGAAAV